MRPAAWLAPFAVLVLLLPAVPGLPGAQAPGVRASLCEAPVDVPGQGLSCPMDGGWAVPLADGRVLFTHGPDPVPQAPLALPGLHAGAASPTGVESAAVACVHDETQPHVRVLYAYPAGGPDRTQTLTPSILAGVHQANGILLANALPHGWDLRFRVLCRPDGSVDLGTVGMAITRSEANFGSIISDISSRGYDNPMAKYWVVYDGRVLCGCGGQGNVWWDDSPGVGNGHNQGGFWALNYMGNYGDQSLVFSLSQVMLHEATHTMGGVQLSAPNTSGAFHCNDGADIMCYDDGGPKSDGFRWTACPRVPNQFSLAATWPYDCGNDDYFHPAPAPGTYLATRWNVGGEANLYLARAPAP